MATNCCHASLSSGSRMRTNKLARVPGDSAIASPPLYYYGQNQLDLTRFRDRDTTKKLRKPLFWLEHDAARPFFHDIFRGSPHNRVVNSACKSRGKKAVP